MTAEVVVLNREAVAIAADSAVTLRGPDPKIYNSANKLFQLSAVEPIAIMVYGSAAFGPIPWETAVKEYRRKLGKRAFETVEQYASEFIDSLSSLVPHYPARMQQELVLRVAYVELAEVYDRLQQVANKSEADGQELEDDDKNTILMEVMADRITQMQTEICADQISAAVAGQEISSAIPDWNGFLEERLAGIAVGPSLSRRARALVRNSLRSVSPSQWSSGVVIIGFGTEQLFPAFSHYVIDGVVAKHTRARHLDSVRMDEDRSACIRAFAQGDMVQTFMDGLHPIYPKALRGLVARTIDLLIEGLSDKLATVVPDDEVERYARDLEEIKSAIVEGFEESLQDLLRSTHYGPIMSIVGVLPKEELAEMAETLVSLTSFKRRVTPEAETVGGPIDVAVISKGDGMVWVKRKHYFDRELNVRYFERDRRLYTEVEIREDSNDR